MKYFLIVLFYCLFVGAANGQLIINPQTAVEFDLQGYDGLEVLSLTHGLLKAENKQQFVDMPYRGLALLVFAGGQKYPVILSEESVELTITSPDVLPSFTDSDENRLLYSLLAGETLAASGNSFAALMVHGKKLLESSSSIQTITELRSKKKEFEEFVQNNYQKLSHSDLLRKFISQYFMMHEYVSYHQKGQSAGDSGPRYQEEVLAGVASWLKVLKDHIPENEVLNYCVGLYYDRGMVTLASLIVNNFKTVAYCSGEVSDGISLPDDLHLVTAEGRPVGKLGALKGAAIISLVSIDCPVSKTVAVIKAREFTETEKISNKQVLVIVPTDKLSEKHFAMNRNVSGGNMLFVDDEEWRRKNFPKVIRLPLEGIKF